MSRREDSPRPAPPRLAVTVAASRAGVGSGAPRARPAPPGPRMRQAIYAAAVAVAREPEPRAGLQVSAGERGRRRRAAAGLLARRLPGALRAVRAVGTALLQSGPGPATGPTALLPVCSDRLPASTLGAAPGDPGQGGNAAPSREWRSGLEEARSGPVAYSCLHSGPGESRQCGVSHTHLLVGVSVGSRDAAEGGGTSRAACSRGWRVGGELLNFFRLPKGAVDRELFPDVSLSVTCGQQLRVGTCLVLSCPGSLSLRPRV